MADKTHRTARFVAVGAATCISLACGTNYAYSAWAPQFADRMHLSATQSNLIGAAGNIGMYASGIPLGHMVDTRGPRPGVLLGSIALGVGYYPIKTAYDAGAGSMGVPLLFFLSFLTGFGSCSAFQASIKTAALNWPLHRGTATAFPLAAFGLSAFFFTTLSGFVFGDDTSEYLLLLAMGTFVLTFVPLFFIRVPHPEDYLALATSESQTLRRDSNQLLRTQTWQTKFASRTQQDPAAATASDPAPGSEVPDVDADEVSSLLSASSGPGDIDSQADEDKLGGSLHRHHSHRLDITGLQLLKTTEFYSLWVMLGILTGIGLMTINNIGNDAQALWYSFDGEVSKSFIQGRQLMHVSIISVMSFIGRLLSGVGSDVLVKRMQMSRFWCLVCSSIVFALAQIAALNVSNPHFLWVVSGLSGLGYGALFGVYPALVADTFGVSGLSLNWGFMTIAPVLWGNVFNLAYGGIFDKHSKELPNHERICEDGLECYKAAYWFTFASSLVGIVVSLWCVWHERMVRIREEAEKVGDHTA